MTTRIEWTDETWNPVTGCDPISAGCQNCYARRMANRLKGRFGYPAGNPFAVTVHWDKMEQPLKWKKPRRVFVCSMGDLFHEDVPLVAVREIFRITQKAPQHTYIFLTKRPVRATNALNGIWRAVFHGRELMPGNIWFGVSAEDQDTYDDRVSVLMDLPAAVRFVSLEPILTKINLALCYQCQADPSKCHEHFKLDWIICGAETGPGKRKPWSGAIPLIMKQARIADVPFFFKGWGGDKKDPMNRMIYRKLYEQFPERKS